MPAPRWLVLAVAAGLTAGATGFAPAAWAGDAVVGADPADRAVLTDAPHAVDLHTSTRPDPAASHVTVWDDAGNDLDTGTLARVGDDELRQPVAIHGTGNFTIAYHVVFSDGRDTVGVVRFSVGTGVAPPVPDAAGQRADEALARRHDHDIDPISGTFLVLDVVVVAAVGLLLLVDPRRRHPPVESRRSQSS